MDEDDSNVAVGGQERRENKDHDVITGRTDVF